MTTPSAKFLEGDLMRHVIIMTASSSIGLISIFLVDFVDLLFISMLGEAELAAAVGFAGTLLFITFSMSIGLTIAASALAAQRLGQGDPVEARRITTSVIIWGLILTTLVGAAVWLLAHPLVALLGATGETADYAVSYLRIVIVSMPIAAIGMMSTGLLRAHGDARRAMTVTLVAGAVNAILDPIFIFGMGLGLEGAAYASVCARIAMAITALYPIFKHYGGFAIVPLRDILRDARTIFVIAGPAILTNIATPFGNGFVTRAMAEFGDAAVAGYAVAGRLMPLAFAAVFALSGAVGPIIGQNFGARNYTRVKTTLTKALQFVLVYTLAISLVLILTNGFLSTQFQLSADGRELIFWFALIVAPLYVFNGTLFISNAAFNNLRRPIYSSYLNWGKNTLGTLPFIWGGAVIFGAPGVLIGQAIGGVLFGVLGLWLAYRLVDKYASGDIDPDKGFHTPLMRARAEGPFNSPRG